MPKSVQYRTNSVIYFQNDVEDKVYILQKGSVVLNSTDIETGKPTNEYIREGEFFGVKSALAHFPREETVMVLSDSTVLVFTAAEFESLAMSNTRIIMKMLKVFSNQLRKIHRQTESLLQSAHETRPDDGLFSVAEAFYNSKDMSAAYDIYNRYLSQYPDGKRAAEARANAEKAKQLLNAEAKNKTKKNANEGFAAEESGGASLDDKTAFILAEQLLSRNKYGEAYAQYRQIAQDDSSSLKSDAYVGMGKCLFFEQDYAESISALTKMITGNPKHPKLAEALFFIGRCHKAQGAQEKADAFFKKALSMASPELAEEIKKIQNEED